FISLCRLPRGQSTNHFVGFATRNGGVRMHRLRGYLVTLSLLAVVVAIGGSGSWGGQTESPYAVTVEKLAGDSKEAKAGIANEGPSGTYEAEQAELRAYPADEVPAEAIFNAQSTFQSFKKSGKSVGQWTAIGPLGKAEYPAVLDQFLFDGAPYTASGRVTAMAIAPSCTKPHCRLYIGAAGGGIWATDKALDGNANWTFLTGSLGSNAIGSILLDPSDS